MCVVSDVYPLFLVLRADSYYRSYRYIKLLLVLFIWSRVPYNSQWRCCSVVSSAHVTVLFVLPYGCFAI